MKSFTTKACFTLLLPAFCFFFSTSYAQQLKILDKTYSDAYAFASIIAQTMKLKAPDSANTNTNHWRMQVNLKASDSGARRIIIEFEKDRSNKAGNIIEAVGISGSISDIIELYAALYDKKVKAVKPEDVYTAVTRDGEIISVRTDVQSTYIGFEGAIGRIYIRKD
jgi:hypothetical protein